jgi:antitoxin (DNA-binding transcriptional repressor) of toxin-antitoxin stability system
MFVPSSDGSMQFAVAANCAKAGTPVARLVPFSEKPIRRVPGTAAGKIVIGPDFDAPLPDDVLEAFEQ